MKKNIRYFIGCVLIIVAIIITIVGIINRNSNAKQAYSDGVIEIDPNTIFLSDSGVEVKFSDVIFSKQKQVRKLIVSEQDAKITVTLTDRLIKKLDFDFLKKTQDVSYQAKGYFVVDLSQLEERDIIVDKAKKIVTIKVNHAYLEDISIDPNDVIIEEVNESLLARGDVKLTVTDYNSVEKEIQQRIDEIFNTAENKQKADENAKEAVKETFEPLIKVIDSRYAVEVEFK